MKDYIQHLEEKIGFGQIREMVAQECVNTMALRFVEQMSFSNNYNDIVCNLAQTDEFGQILLMENNFPSQFFKCLYFGKSTTIYLFICKIFYSLFTNRIVLFV